jgi:protein TonB
MAGMVTTLAPHRERIGVRPPRSAGIRAALLLVMAAVHLCVIVAVALWAGRAALSPPPQEPGIAVILAERAVPPPAAATTQIATTALQPPAPLVIARLGPVPPLAIVPDAPTPRLGAARRRPASRHPATPRPLIAPAAPVEPSAQGATGSAGPTNPPQPAAPASLAGWEARIRQAVQDAAIYPAAARLRRREGRAEVRFDYTQGAVTDVSVVHSSHVTALDTAALAAVTRARMPAPPSDVGPQPRMMLVWVQFKLTAAD